MRLVRPLGRAAARRASARGQQIDFAPHLLSSLRGAVLQSQAETTWHGKPSRLLTVTWPRPASAKSGNSDGVTQGTMKIWLDARGIPTEVDELQSVAGHFLLFTSKFANSDTYRLKRTGLRLVVLEWQSTSHTSGVGADLQTHDKMTLRPEAVAPRSPG